MQNLILLRYGEIHLKGLNRPYFIKKLIEAIHAAARPICPVSVTHDQGRFYIEGYPAASRCALQSALCRVFGVHSISPAVAVGCELGAVVSAAVELAGGESGTFKVQARRGDKSFPLNSMQINALVGEAILAAHPALRVDVHNPDFCVYIELRRRAYLYTRSLPGPGGMPVGTAGRAMLLLSGGIDSPVAGYSMLRRGVELQAVYFHSPPHTSEMAHRKVKRLAGVLSGYGCQIKLHSVPFTQIQETIYQACHGEYLTLLTRRFMMRAAQAIALEQGCGCLVTGENLGQVASQTMAAMHATAHVVNQMPVFRPLLAYDKMEIVQYAGRIGTFDISIEPYEDCCTVFVPRHPVTRPRLTAVEREERKLNVEELLCRALEQTETEIIGE